MTAPLELQVWQALSRTPMSPTDVAEVINAAPAGVYTAFRRLRDSGYITLLYQDGRSRVYRVTDKKLTAERAAARERRQPRREVGDRPDGYGSGGRIALEECWGMRA